MYFLIEKVLKILYDVPKYIKIKIPDQILYYTTIHDIIELKAKMCSRYIINISKPSSDKQLRSP